MTSARERYAMGDLAAILDFDRSEAGRLGAEGWGRAAAVDVVRDLTRDAKSRAHGPLASILAVTMA